MIYALDITFNIDESIQLYAEPSAIQYIRSNFKVEDVVIVSPDAGGAKRYFLITEMSLQKLIPFAQSNSYRRSPRCRLRSLPQRT